MEIHEFRNILKSGEGVDVEFKRCGGQPGEDTFETICAFANHAGGDLFLGVTDNASVAGVNKESVLQIERNIQNILNNTEVFKPAVEVLFDPFQYNEKTVIRVRVPVDAFVHSFKGVVYDRRIDSDIQLTQDSQIASLYLKKQATYTEQRIYPFIDSSDLELTLLNDVRSLVSRKNANHSWIGMDDDSLLRSAGLYARDYMTGEEGYNLAAVLLLGTEELISSIAPSYKTDAIYRAEEEDRYDDREIVACNLLRAHPKLEEFCKRHIDDRFYLENSQAISPRDIIIRELVTNTLIHREYSAPFPARIVITNEEIVTENASKAFFEGPLDLTRFAPMPKNPLIAKFFNNIGWAEELGSGTRNLLKYTKAYSGQEPYLVDGNIFEAKVPLIAKRDPQAINPEILNRVLFHINQKGYVTTVDVRDDLGIEHKAAQRELAKMVENGALRAEGNTRARKYYSTAVG